MNAQQPPALKIARLNNLTINYFGPEVKAEPTHGVVLSTFESVSSIPPLGAYWPGEGGHNAGLVRGENGQRDYYLIVAGGAAAEFRAEYGGYEHKTDSADSASDGQANTLALLADSEDHPAAKLVSEYTADGHSDFYLAARRELQVAEANAPELFSKGYHWSSTQSSAYHAYSMGFEGGWQSRSYKSYERLVRPVRRKFL
ncbi:DUF1566 domain-containing protein [Pseudomonas sp. GD04087]|uniref:DUF1566 domain-containing protein n=1 Tax=unclassified Pseudomonas TaxID=196821 RepID=UPI00244C99BB|nr:MULTISPECIES: DUF1566 domain-containing protein [unclassified Pseudomonas]MDH0293374.1 DUF1566 domain-containing protein [Pseudomonas sp. GD04087]MDH1053031.1 DUF1566 domain-containing protein [Pseudomonas sp. GD03903]MDH2003593.1 DUF1566 domain-containing protein [Pseudomonas sp. GD03691]